jgi:LacI family transcriptional regulator
VINSPHSIEAATDVAADLLARDPLPTAVFSLSDSIACGVYAAAAARGLEIPRDLAVAGYDGHPIASVVAPPLTSVEWGMPDVAASAAALLAAAVAGRPRSRGRARVRVSPELMARASTTGVPALTPSR